jgi:hypothetical protein
VLLLYYASLRFRGCQLEFHSCVWKAVSFVRITLQLNIPPGSPMESYLREAFNELFAEDGLTVVARGLGVNNLYSKFAQYYANRDHGRKLVFCINCTGVEDQLQDLFLTSSDAGIKDLPQVGGLLYCR